MALPVLDTATYFIIITSIINTTFSIVLVLLLFNNFLRKRTVGTFMLLGSYFFFTATSVMSIIYRTMYIANGLVNTPINYFIASLGPLLLLPAFAFLYMFACRHILKDNEIIRTFMFAMITFFYGFATAFVVYDNIVLFYTPADNLLLLTNLIIFKTPADSLLLLTEIVPITPYLFTISYTLFIQLFQIIISIYITGRIGWRALRLARKSDQPVRKRGLQTIGIGVLLYLVGGMLSAFDAQVAGIPALMIVIAVFRSLSFSVAYVLMYLGWIMPKWYRKMIRKKSWFEMQYQNVQKS
ncbi:MAG: hypothetical protein ACTSQF_09575 [Candidatus Heimdallarchaeaceae archaeon]